MHSPPVRQVSIHQGRSGSWGGDATKAWRNIHAKKEEKHKENLEYLKNKLAREKEAAEESDSELSELGSVILSDDSCEIKPSDYQVWAKVVSSTFYPGKTDKGKPPYVSHRILT